MTCLRIVTDVWDLIKDIYESLRFCFSLLFFYIFASFHLTTFIQSDYMSYERNRLLLYETFLRLLLSLAQMEEAPQQRKQRRRQARRRFWCWTWLSRSVLFGWYHHLLHELNWEDPASYNNFLRVHFDFWITNEMMFVLLCLPLIVVYMYIFVKCP